MERVIIKVGYKEWSRFQPFLVGGPCCNLAFPQGDCYAILSGAGIESMAAMVWYTYAFRHCPWRNNAIPGFRSLSRKEQIAFLNANVRTLARISTLPQFRRVGFAGELLNATLSQVGVRYIECLTAWDDVRKLLAVAGFVRFPPVAGSPIDYWLFMVV